MRFITNPSATEISKGREKVSAWSNRVFQQTAQIRCTPTRGPDQMHPKPRPRPHAPQPEAQTTCTPARGPDQMHPRAWFFKTIAPLCLPLLLAGKLSSWKEGTHSPVSAAERSRARGNQPGEGPVRQQVRPVHCWAAGVVTVTPGASVQMNRITASYSPRASQQKLSLFPEDQTIINDPG